MPGNTTIQHFFYLIIIAGFLPPLAVAMEFGCGKIVVKNALFSLIPFCGFIHAFYLFLTYRYDVEVKDENSPPNVIFEESSHPDDRPVARTAPKETV